MNSKNRVVKLRVATLAAAGVMLAGCAQPPEEQAQSGNPASPNPPAQLTDAESAALEALEAVEEGSYYLHLAHYQIVEQCLQSRGITVYPSSAVSDPLIDVAQKVGTPEAIALWYADGKVPNSTSIAAEPALAEYGYSGVATQNTGQDPRDQAYFALTRTEQEKVQIALDGRDADLNQAAPFAESCIGQAYQVTSGGKSPFDGLDDSTMTVVMPIIDGISTPEGQTAIKETPELKTARSAWEKCMSAQNRAANWPPGKAVAGEAADPAQASAQANQEAQYAETDAACGQEAGLNAAYRGAVKAWRTDQVKQHLSELQAFFAVRDPQVAAAKQYLGIK